MGIATFPSACCPPISRSASWRRILLVAVRVMQGLAFGAEWGGAILMTFEQRRGASGPLHRHPPGRFPARAAAGQPGLPGQRAAGRRMGVAGAVPAQRRPDRRRHLHPAQGRGVAGVRGAEGRRRDRQEPARGGAPQRLAQRGAGLLPADRRDRRLRRVGHLHAVVPQSKKLADLSDHADRTHDRRRGRHRRTVSGARSPTASGAAGLPVRHRDDDRRPCRCS